MRKIKEAIEFLCERFPQFEHHMRAWEVVPSEDVYIASVTPKRLEVNIDKFIPFSQPDTRGILLHELGHIAIPGMRGFPKKEPELCAAEMVINDTFYEDYKAMHSTYILEECMYFPHKWNMPRHQSFDFYVKLLREILEE